MEGSKMIISVSNRKGGQGKTFLSGNIAYMLGLKKKKSLCIDLDSQGNLTKFFRKETISYDDFINCETVSVNDYMDLLPATKRAKSLQREIDEQTKPVAFIEKYIINKIKDKYDHVIIDTSPSLDVINFSAFYASDLVIIPVKAQDWSIDGKNEVKEIIEEINNEYKKNIKYTVVFNFFKGENRILYKDFLKPLLDQEEHYSNIVIPDLEYVEQSTTLGNPAIDNQKIYDPINQLVETFV